MNLRRFSAGPDFEKLCVEIIFIDHQTCQKPYRTRCCEFSSLHDAGVGPTWKSSYNLVIDGHLSVSGDVQQYSKCGYIIHHGLFCLHAKYHYTKLGHIVVMNSWNVDIEQKQKYFVWAE